MTTKSIHDWIIELGFSNTKVRKGVKETEKLLNKINKIHLNATKSIDQSLKRQTSELTRQNQILKRREQIVDSTVKKLGYTQRMPKGRMPGAEGTGTQRAPSAGSVAKSEARRIAREAAFGASVMKLGTDINDFELQSKQMKMAEVGAGDLKRRIIDLRNALSEAKDPVALKNIRTELVSTRRAAQRYEKAQRNVNKEMNAMKFASGGIISSLKNLARSYLSVFAAISGVVMVVNQMKELDTIRATFLAASGDAKQAAIDFQYVKDIAVSLGTDLAVAAKGYSQIAIAGKEAGLTTAQTRNIFEAMSESAIAFGLNADDTAGIMRAVTQSLSKGVVAAEELRGQLGDRMPIAVSTMAKSLGVTTKELDGMMRRGELIASEVLPKFANELRKTAREGGALAAGMNTVTAAQSRMTTAWTAAIGEMMDAGGKQGVVDIFELLTTTIKALTPAFKVLGTTLKYIGSILKTVLTPIITTFGFAFQAAQGFVEMLDSSLGRLGKKLEGIIRPIKAVLDAYSVLQETLGSEKNSLDAAADVLFGTERGKFLENKMNQAMVRKGYDSFKNTGSTSKTTNVTVNFTANGTDPKGVYTEFDRMFQGTLKGLSVGPN